MLKLAHILLPENNAGKAISVISVNGALGYDAS